MGVRLLTVFSLSFVTLSAATVDPLNQSAQKKMDLLESQRAARGSTISFSPAELNAWARAKAMWDFIHENL